MSSCATTSSPWARIVSAFRYHERSLHQSYQTGTEDQQTGRGENGTQKRAKPPTNTEMKRVETIHTVADAVASEEKPTTFEK